MMRAFRYVSMSSGRSRIIAYGLRLACLRAAIATLPKLLGLRAELVHVAVRPHADDVDRPDEPPGRVERLVVA
jgi:hypothetical protein